MYAKYWAWSEPSGNITLVRNQGHKLMSVNFTLFKNRNRNRMNTDRHREPLRHLIFIYVTTGRNHDSYQAQLIHNVQRQEYCHKPFV